MGEQECTYYGRSEIATTLHRMTVAKKKKPEREALRKQRQRERLEREEAERRARVAHVLRLRIGGALAVALFVLATVFMVGRGGSFAGGGGGEYAFEVGTPGPGERAPRIELRTTADDAFDLSSLRGQTVLLYFQEGIGCQPCWTQLTDIETRLDDFKRLGIDKIATITTDPPDLLARKVADEGLNTPVMSDSTVAVSNEYSTTDFRMAGMGPTFNGHSFVLVNEDGVIEWRADYGGPKTGNTMYVPVDSLLADIEQGMSGRSS